MGKKFRKDIKIGRCPLCSYNEDDTCKVSSNTLNAANPTIFLNPIFI